MLKAGELMMLGAALSDTKDHVYRNTLAIAALMETLVAEGVVSREALAAVAERLDRLGDAPTPPSSESVRRLRQIEPQ